MRRSHSLFLVLMVAAPASPAVRAAPNVLLIMADDLRPELAGYGSVAVTPNLDRLAARSVQFDRAYCQQAVCNPSRSSMLTGRRPDTLGVWSNSVHFRDHNPDVPTIPLWFKEHGYTTRCTGKIFHNWHTRVRGDPEDAGELRNAIDDPELAAVRGEARRLLVARFPPRSRIRSRRPSRPPTDPATASAGIRHVHASLVARRCRRA